MADLYVFRDDHALLISRRRLRGGRGRPVPHAWAGLSETAVSERSVSALVVGLPVVAGGVTAAFGAVEAGIVAGGLGVLATSYLAPGLRRRVVSLARAARSRDSRRAEVIVLTEPAAFDRVVGLADGISETWPELGSLVDPAQASAMLGEALRGIAELLARREELTGVLAGLSDAGLAPSGHSTVLGARLTATKTALSEIEIELARREADLRRAEDAGRAFAREQQTRRAIHIADASLRARPSTPAGPDDAGRDLAEHTQSVLAAYRELLANGNPDQDR